jgi:ribosomal protein S18 acetylase RimI-like enzyme
MKTNSLTLLTLEQFLEKYAEDLEEYYDEDFGSDKEKDIGNGDTHIYCLVDTGRNRYTSPKAKKNIRRAGKHRRNKIKHRYSYENPMNRIHGYLISDEIKNSLIPEEMNLLSLSLICSSVFSDTRGIGTELMNHFINYASENGYSDIVLEVSNEWAGINESDEDESDDGDESDDEDESNEEEEDDLWTPSEEVIDILSHEFWRKTMRKVEEDVSYYNVSKEYISENISNYLFSSVGEIEEKIPKYLSSEPGENDYGGFWYKKGKREQKKLMDFYRKFGFYEEPEIHLSWHCYGDSPFPTMVKSL